MYPWGWRGLALAGGGWWGLAGAGRRHRASLSSICSLLYTALYTLSVPMFYIARTCYIDQSVVSVVSVHNAVWVRRRCGPSRPSPARSHVTIEYIFLQAKHRNRLYEIDLRQSQNTRSNFLHTTVQNRLRVLLFVHRLCCLNSWLRHGHKDPGDKNLNVGIF